MNYGEKIRNLRKINGYSQEELAHELKLSRQSISLWENNQAQPTLENLRSICSIFNISLDSLVGNENNRDVIHNDDSIIEVSIKRTKKSIFWEDQYSDNNYRYILFSFFLTWSLLGIVFLITKRYEGLEYSILISSIVTGVLAYFILPHYLIKRINLEFAMNKKIEVLFKNASIIVKDSEKEQEYILNGFDYYVNREEYYGLVLYNSIGHKRRIFIPKYLCDDKLEAYLTNKIQKRNLLGIRILK